MKIICEYCKNSIDTDKNEKCPNCNASYHNNKEFKERLEYLKKEKDLALETRRLQNETFKTVLGSTQSVFKASKYITIGIIIFALAIMITMIVTFTKTTNSGNITTTKEIKVEVNLGQFAETSQFKVMVDKVTKIDKLYESIKPPEGKVYKAFHFVVKNKLDKSLILPFEINCVVDEYAQKEVYYLSKYPSLPSYVASELKVEGYAIYEVPEDAKKFDIKYGDYVTIHIEEK